MSNNKLKNPASKAPLAETKSQAKPAEAKAPAPQVSAAKSAPPKAPAPLPVERPPVPALFRRIDWVSFAITTLVVFVGYWWTLAPDLTLEDSGELAVGSMYAGVPHPPGYPVWTIYSWLFTVLVPVSNIAYRVGLSSAVAGAFGCGLVALMVSRGSSMMIEGIADLKNLERRWENALCIVSGFVAGMLIGFNGFMWSQAVIVEVYTLSVLSLAGVLLCLMRWIYAPYQYRYLYMAFFWFGISFNNHQSLLVVVLGLELAVIVTQPRLGRDLLFWNMICYLGGVIGMQMDLISVLKDNTPLQIIYHVIGVVSTMIWLFLLFRTRIRGVELLRDFTMVLTVGYLALVFGTITHYSLVFYYTDGTTLKPGLLILCSLVGLACMGVFGYLIKTTHQLGHEWRFALICGVCFAVGAAFYLYMPLASMSNPPLNWGYPRTVTGFFHAFTRGQYEKIHPTTTPGKFIEQIWMYIAGATEEFNLVYLAIGLLPFFFYRRMQPRERAWLIGLTGIYLMLSLFLLLLLNPAPDRQSRDLNKVFFTASHVMVAMGIGYGVTLVGAQLALQYERFRKWALISCATASGIALFVFFDTIWQTSNPIAWLSHLFGSRSWALPNPVIVYTALSGVGLAVGATVLFFVGRTRLPLRAFVALAALMPIYSIMSHWEENEQRGHLFGYWFGHDMFTPPFHGPDGKPLYPEMTRDTVLFGGTDPGRFNPTYMIFCESFIPPSKKSRDPNFDRRDVYLITQNALADGTYLNYIRAHYNRGTQYDPPFFSELLRGPKELALNVETNFVARMMIPIDRFFLNLGDRIEEKRRVGSSFFKESDFLDLQGLLAKLKPGPQQSPLAKYLYDSLSKRTQALLTGGGDSHAVGRALARDLNVILDQQIGTDPAKRQPLYDPGRFEGVALSARTQRFVRQVQEIYTNGVTYPNQNVHTPIRLARLLLEEAYPKEIAKSPSGVYPDLEIRTPSGEDSQRCFTEYLNEAQRRLDHDRRAPNEPKQIKPGEDVRIIDNRVQVSGQVAVMAINALLTRVIFDANPDHEFFVEESFPLEWMYPYLSPFGIIMKINRNQLPELTEEIVRTDHDFWSQFSQRLIGNWITYDTSISNLCAFAETVYYRRNYKGFKGDPKFVRDNDGQKAFSKLRSSIAGVYSWRISNSKSPLEQQRMIKEAEFAFKQAYAFCPYSPEAIFRYINLLIGFGRVDDALLLASTSRKLDPNNGQLENLVFELQRIRQQQQQQAAAAHVQAEAAPTAGQSQALVAQLEQQLRAQPSNMAVAIQLITAYIQNQQSDRALALVDQIVGNPTADANMLIFAAQVYQQLNNLPKLEQTLTKMVKLSPDNPEAWFDLAGIQAMINMPSQAVVSLDESLSRSAQRLARDANAANLYSNAQSDPRFVPLRGVADFQKVLDKHKPRPK